MPRIQRTELRRTRKNVRASVTRDESPIAPTRSSSKDIRRSPRSRANVGAALPRQSEKAGADRVTRSKSHPTKRRVVHVESNDEDSESEEEVMPRKRTRLSDTRATPKKQPARGTPKTADKGRKQRAEVNRRKSKDESEESNESVDMSENEDDDDDDDKAYTAKFKASPVAPTSRRSSRSATRNRGTSSSHGCKSVPSVVLKRVENEWSETPSSVKSGRGRPSKQRKGRTPRKEATLEPSSDDDSGDAEYRSVAQETTPSSRASRPKRAAASRQSGGVEQRGRRQRSVTPPTTSKRPARRQSVRQKQQSPPKQQQREQRSRPQRQPARRSSKMVPSEENAAATTTTTTTTESLKKEEEGEDVAAATKKDGSEDEGGRASESDVKDEEEKDGGGGEVEDNNKTGEDDSSEVVVEDEEEDKEKDQQEENVSSSATLDDEDKRDSIVVETKAGDEDDDGDKEEKMDVDEPEVISPAAEEAAPETDKPAGTKPAAVLDVTEDSVAEVDGPPSKKIRTDDGDVNTAIVSDKVEKIHESGDDIKPKETSEKQDVVMEDAVGTINGEGISEEQDLATVTSIVTSVNGTTAAEEKNAVVNDVDGKETDGGSNGCNTENNVIYASLGRKIPRQCVVDSKFSDVAGKDTFSVVSFNLANDDWAGKHQNLVNEVVQLSPSILCLQEIDEVYFKNFLDSALKSHGYMGLYRAGKATAKGLASFYLLSAFEILHHREVEVSELLEKDIQSSDLQDAEKEALKSYLHSPAPVLIVKLKFASSGKTVTVGTVHLPGDDDTVLAIQTAAVMRELLAISGGANDPHVLCGSFNLREDSIVSQVLKDGHLKSDVISELKAKANVPIPDKERASVTALLEKSFQHPSTSLKSSYGSVLGHELKFPDKSVKFSRDSVWFSSDSLLTRSILDVGALSEETAPNAHISLKAELAFVN